MVESIRHHPADVDPLNPAISTFIPHGPRPGLVPQGTQITLRVITRHLIPQLQSSCTYLVTNYCVSPVNELSAPTFPTDLAPELAQHDAPSPFPVLLLLPLMLGTGVSRTRFATLIGTTRCHVIILLVGNK